MSAEPTFGTDALFYPFLKPLPFGMGLQSYSPVDDGDVLKMLLTTAMLPLPIKDWTTRMHYEELSNVEKCRILSVEHWKLEKCPEHEYIIVKYRCIGIESSKTYIRYARIDRNIEAYRHGGLATRSSTGVKLKLGASVGAEDTIIISAEPFVESDSYLLYAADFIEGLDPSMADLSALLEVLSEVAPKYHLYTYMCYWHSRMVFDALVYRFSGRMRTGQSSKNRGKFMKKFNLIDLKGRFVLWRFFHLGKSIGNATEEEIKKGVEDEFVVSVNGPPYIADLPLEALPYPTLKEVLDRLEPTRKAIRAAMAHTEKENVRQRLSEKEALNQRIASERRQAEEAAKREAERRIAAERQRAEEERQRAEERGQALTAERRKAEEERRKAEEERRKAEEERQKAEQEYRRQAAAAEAEYCRRAAEQERRAQAEIEQLRALLNKQAIS